MAFNANTDEKVEILANILENNLDTKRKELFSASSDDSVLDSPGPANKKLNKIFFRRHARQGKKCSSHRLKFFFGFKVNRAR